MVDLRNMPQAEIERRHHRAYVGRILVGLYAERSRQTDPIRIAELDRMIEDRSQDELSH